VLQYDPTQANEALTLDVDISGMANDIQQVVAFVVARNLSSSIYWQCNMQLHSLGGALGPVTRWKIMDTTVYDNPNIFAFGITGAHETRPAAGLTKLRCIFKHSDTGTSSDALQLDYFCAIGISHSARILDLTQLSSPKIKDVHIKHRRDTHLRPVAQRLASGVWEANMESSSNLSLSAKGDKVAVLAFGVDNQSIGGDGWRLLSLAGVPLNYSITVDRTQAFLTPR
jgi:hypothetical protein